MANEGRLPRPRGIITDRVRRAITLYKRMWADDAPPMTLERRTIATGILQSLITCMTTMELADYYANVRLVQLGGEA